MALIDVLAPLKENISSKRAWYGLLILSIIYFFSLFFPWVTIDAGLTAVDGGASSGWNELGFIAILPIVPQILYAVVKNKSFKIIFVIAIVGLSLFIFIDNNIIHKSVWASVNDPMNVSGSSFAVGFWIGLLSLIGTDLCCLSWALHQSSDQLADSVG